MLFFRAMAARACLALAKRLAREPDVARPEDDSPVPVVGARETLSKEAWALLAIDEPEEREPVPAPLRGSIADRMRKNP